MFGRLKAKSLVEVRQQNTKPIKKNRSASFFDAEALKTNNILQAIVDALANLPNDKKFNFDGIQEGNRFEAFATACLLYLCIPEILNPKIDDPYLKKSLIYSLLKYLHLDEPDTPYTELLKATTDAAQHAAKEQRVSSLLKPIELLRNFLAHLAWCLQNTNLKEEKRLLAAQQFKDLFCLFNEDILKYANETDRYELKNRLEVCYESIPQEWPEKGACKEYLSYIGSQSLVEKIAEETIRSFAHFMPYF